MRERQMREREREIEREDEDERNTDEREIDSEKKCLWNKGKKVKVTNIILMIY
jgi:hypothetical protein